MALSRTAKKSSLKTPSNTSFGGMGKMTDLRNRILFTLGALVVYRLGTYIPLPGIDPIVLEEIFSRNAQGIVGVFDMFAGGALSRMTIFALNILPYISASIVMQLLVHMVPSMEQMRKEGESGRIKINQYTRYGTVGLAAFQAYFIAVGLESLQTQFGGSAVFDPGLYFRISTVVSLTAGTMFLVWLGEQVTQRGVGNGVSLIIFAGIVANLPRAAVETLELGRIGALSTFFIIVLIMVVIAVIAFIVFIERSQRRVMIHYPKRSAGIHAQQSNDSSHIPMKINMTGVIPPIFASSILLMPLTIVGFSDPSSLSPWLQQLVSFLGRGQIGYMLLYASLILGFAFFYAPIVFNAKNTADNLWQGNGFIPGIRPGPPTAGFLDSLLYRLTLLGGFYLVAVCLIPELLISYYNVPFYFGGTSLLIVVTVTIDTVANVQSHLLSYQYSSLIKRAKGKRKNA